MTLRHFEIFITVCNTMNMTAAAEKLFISQSAISQAIGELEKHYGLKLFERLSKKLYLTQAGQKLESYARHMIRMNQEVEMDMKKTLHQGFIRIGVSVTLGTHVLPKLVSHFKEKYPNCLIYVWENNTKVIENMLLTDQIDIALVEGETMSSDILVFPFMDDELVLICARQHKFAALSSIMPEDLANEDWIVREIGSGTRQTFEEKMAAQHLKWKAVWTCNNADTIKIAVSENLGISVISRRAALAEIQNGILLQKKINGLTFRRQFKIIYHKNKYLTEPIRNFIDFCFLPSIM